MRLEKQAGLLQSFLATLGQMPELNIEKDLMAKYLDCNTEDCLEFTTLHECLLKLSCILHEKFSKINL